MERLKQRGGNREIRLAFPPLDWTGSPHGEAMGQGSNAFQGLLNVFFIFIFGSSL